MEVDLGGEDIKHVSYTIAFVKPEFEATLQSVQGEVIARATDEGSFAGLKLGEFVEKLRRESIPLPPTWDRSPGDGYPEVGQPLTGIPDRDKKYLKCVAWWG